MTEIGRQPWTVFGLLTVEDSVSPGVTAGEVWFSLISFTTIYSVLLFMLIYLFIRTARKGPEAEQPENVQEPVFDPYAPEGGDPVVVK